MFKVYIAAASTTEEIARVKKWSEIAIRDGLITPIQTWPEEIAKVGSANPRDASKEDRLKWGNQDLAEAAASDLVWFLVPVTNAPGRGGYYESGYKTALRHQVVYSGDTKQSVFCAQGMEFPSDELAYAYICDLARSKQ
jgi:hypothetical protein